MSELVNIVLHTTVASAVATAVITFGAIDTLVLCSRLLRFIAREVRQRVREETAEWRRDLSG